MKLIDKFIIRILLLTCKILSRYSDNVYTHEISHLDNDLKDLDECKE